MLGLRKGPRFAGIGFRDADGIRLLAPLVSLRDDMSVKLL
jgi:hypothetical protein